jgi:hypothetical protein
MVRQVAQGRLSHQPDKKHEYYTTIRMMKYCNQRLLQTADITENTLWLRRQ